MRGFWRSLASDSQLRWLGPEKGVMHLATAAVVNAVWDLWAKRAGRAALEAARVDLTPEEIVACIDFRYITDVLAPDEALDLLRERSAADATKREQELLERRLPRLHDLGRLARLRRREGRGARARGGRRRLHATSR